MPIRRQYAGAAVQTTITSSLNSSATSIDIASTTGWPSGATPYFVVISPGTTAEEKCLATRSSSTLTLTRGQDGTTGQSHASGATIYPVLAATDADEANELASVMTTKGDLISRSSSVTTRLGVGSNGSVLFADSTKTSGLAWVPNPTFAWVSGEYYRTPGEVGSSHIATKDRLYLYPMFTPTDVTLDRIQVKASQITQTATVRLGLYAESSGKPSTLILDAGTVSVPSGTDQVVEVTISQAVSAGFFFVGAVLQTTLTSTRNWVGFASDRNMPNPYILRVSDSYYDYGSPGFYKDGITGSLPSSVTVDGYTSNSSSASTVATILPRVRVA